jgi:hypothetical protein
MTQAQFTKGWAMTTDLAKHEITIVNPRSYPAAFDGPRDAHMAVCTCHWVGGVRSALAIESGGNGAAGSYAAAEYDGVRHVWAVGVPKA